jgi:hypothetical protein
MGRRYWVETRDLDKPSGWQVLEGGVPVMGQGGEVSVRLADKPERTGRFYRIRIEP